MRGVHGWTTFGLAVAGLATFGLLAGAPTLVSAGHWAGTSAAGGAADATANARQVEAQDAGTPVAREDERAALAARLRQRLSETRERIARYQQHEQGLVNAIARLEAGESPEAIYNSMRERLQQGMRERRGEGAPADERAVGGAREDGSQVRGQRPDGARDGPDRFGERLGERGAARGAGDPALRDRLLANLREHSPAIYERVRTLGREQPEQSDRVLQRLMPRIQQIQGVQKEDPELATLMIHELHANLDLMMHSRDLREAMQAGDRDEASIEALRAGVRDALRRSFDAHLAVKRREVAGLEAKIEGLRDEIRKREELKEQFIERQADQIEGSGLPTIPGRGAGGQG